MNLYDHKAFESKTNFSRSVLVAGDFFKIATSNLKYIYTLFFLSLNNEIIDKNSGPNKSTF